MKNLLKNLALMALILAVASPVFAAKAKAWKVNKDGTADIELWYGAAVTEAGPPPADWIAYKIIKEKLGINLILTALPSGENDQDTKINAAGAANSLPDIFMVSDRVLPMLVKQGLVADVTNMYKMMPNRTAKLYDKDAIAFSTINGKSFALAQPGSIARNEGVLIREDWLKKLGLSVPKTTDEYFNVMKAFTEKDPDGNGKNDTWGFGAYLEVGDVNEGLGKRFDPIMGAFGVAGTWNLTKSGFGLNIMKPEFYDAMQYVKKLVDEKVIDPNWTAYKKDDFRASWKQGKFGIFREQNAAYASESNYAPFDQNFPNGGFLIIDPPVGPSGKSSCGTYTVAYRMYALAAATAGSTAKINGKKVTKMEKIAELLEWMSSDEGYYLLGWGQKGVNYVLGSDGIPTVKGIPDASKGYSKPEMQPLTQLRNLVYYNSDIELGARYPTYTTVASKKEMSALKALREMQSKAWTPNVGNALLPKPDADLKRFYEQGVLEFLTGRRELNKPNWDAWTSEFYNKMGGKAWEDEARKVAEANRLLK